MEFTVSKSDLVRELSLSQGVVEKKTTIPILSNVLLEASGDRITLTATDLELGIRCTCPARVKKEGAGTIPARKLLDYVRLLPEGDVQMKFLENHWCSIVSGRSRTRIAGMSRESFPELPEMPEPIASLPIKTLASMISRTSFAISMEESRFTLNGALLVMRPDGLTMVATDGHRLAYVQAAPGEIGEISQPFRALIPKKAMLEIVKLADLAESEGRGVFAGDDNHLFFQVGTRLLITRKLTGNFPDYERVLPKDHIVGCEAAEGGDQVRHRTGGAVRRRTLAGHPRAVLKWRSAGLFLVGGDRRQRRKRDQRIPGSGSRNRLQRTVPARLSPRHTRKIAWPSS